MKRIIEVRNVVSAFGGPMTTDVLESHAPRRQSRSQSKALQLAAKLLARVNAPGRNALEADALDPDNQQKIDAIIQSVWNVVTGDKSDADKVQAIRNLLERIFKDDESPYADPRKDSQESHFEIKTHEDLRRLTNTLMY